MILIGEIKEDILDTPINVFKKAIELSKQDKWVVRTNYPQLVEALEVLCGEDDIDVYLVYDDKLHELEFIEAYGYLGDVYHIINSIRFLKDICLEDADYELSEYIKEYEEKWCAY